MTRKSRELSLSVPVVGAIPDVLGKEEHLI